jgi:hypothetical protein
MELINEDDKWKSEIINGNCSLTQKHIMFDDKWKSEASTKK